MSLDTPSSSSEVADGVTCRIDCFGVSLFREPDAGKLPVRFDEREQETESSQTGLRRHDESPVNNHREATATAPVLDSTRVGVEKLGSKTCFPSGEFLPVRFFLAQSVSYAVAI